ncbi:MAG: FAD-binding protein, partial [Antricoccus sp.]
MIDTETLTHLVTDGRVITDSANMQSYLRDAADMVPIGTPLAVVLAKSTADVIATMRWSDANNVPVIARGAGTGLAGGAAAREGSVVLCVA